jgi:hypothetical protein
MPDVWPMVDTEPFWRTFAALDGSQETIDVLSALACRLARAAADIRPLVGTTMRMIKSRRYADADRTYLPIRLYFAFDNRVEFVLLLIVEEDDELEGPARPAG